MRFTLVALAACHALAMRPELGRASISQRIASIGEWVSKITSPRDSLVALKEATTVLDSVLAESGNATDHMSDDDAQLLNSVISLVEKTIYSSMDDAHSADVAELNAAIATAESCNADIAARQSPSGDLGILHEAVQGKQTELNNLQGVVDDKTEVNNTKWAELDLHMQQISSPPACTGLPHRTMPALDVFFEKSDYVIWYTAQKASYTVLRDAFVAADADLKAAIQAYNIGKAVRDVQYCDWKSELEAACAAFDTCFAEASDYYTKTLVPRVTADMNNRIEVKKAGDTLVHQIKFLLGDVADQETPSIDTSRYTIAFPELPEKGTCDLTPLASDEWVPVVVCSSHRLVDGCTSPQGRDVFAAWGEPRTESDDEKAGEAVCCNDKGLATRHISDHIFTYVDKLTHKGCTTTSTKKLKDDGTDTPSHTFFDAQAICTNAGLRLCRSQEEVNTACNTGCWINAALVWLDDA